MEGGNSPEEVLPSRPKRLEATFDTLMPPPLAPGAAARTSAASTLSSLSSRSGGSYAPAPPPACLDVYLRLRPVPDASEASTMELRSASTVAHRLETTPASKAREYTFCGVFGPQSTQEDVYDRVAAPLVDRLFEDANGLLFAYGVTNSGKSYSIGGDEIQPGVIPRALTRIFERLAAEGALETARLSLRYLEIYNDNLYDLLAEPDAGIAKRRRALRITQDRNGAMDVRGLSAHSVKSVEEGLQLVARGAQNRSSGTTHLNAQSSRSHSVLWIELRRRRRQKPAVLWITDLAGSERSSRTGVAGRGVRQTEANAINTSLMLLFRCLRSLHPSGACAAAAVPFRDSKLTHLFQAHLSGAHAARGRTVMLVCASPAISDFAETQHVLQNSAFAQEVPIVPNEKRLKRASVHLRATHGVDGRKLGMKRRRDQSGSKEPDAKRSSSDSAYLSATSVSLASRGMPVEDVKEDMERELREENVSLRSELERTIEALAAAREGLQHQEVRIREEVAEEWSERMVELQRHWKERMEAGAAEEDGASPAARRPGMSRVAQSAKKQHEAKLVQYISEREETIVELEEEMDRLRARHAQEAGELRRLLAASRDDVRLLREGCQGGVTVDAPALKEAAQEVAAQAAGDAGQEVPAEMSQEGADEAGQEAAMDAADEIAEDPADDAANEIFAEATEESQGRCTLDVRGDLSATDEEPAAPLAPALPLETQSRTTESPSRPDALLAAVNDPPEQASPTRKRVAKEETKGGATTAATAAIKPALPPKPRSLRRPLSPHNTTPENEQNMQMPAKATGPADVGKRAKATTGASTGLPRPTRTPMANRLRSRVRKAFRG